MGGGWYRLQGSLTGANAAKSFGVRVKAGKTVYLDNVSVQVGVGTAQTMYVLNSGTGVTGLNVQGLINGAINGVATFTKAGAITDADFATPADGLMGFDSTNGRLYVRNAGAWSYIAKTAGFQIPDYEAQGLAEGDFLIPYVERKMSDGAVHGLYASWNVVKESLLADIFTKITDLEEIFTDFTTKATYAQEMCVGEASSSACLTKEQVDNVLKLITSPTPTPSPSASPL